MTTVIPSTGDKRIPGRQHSSHYCSWIMDVNRIENILLAWGGGGGANYTVTIIKDGSCFAIDVIQMHCYFPLCFYRAVSIVEEYQQ